MAEGGHKNEFGTPMRPHNSELSGSSERGSQDWYEYYCQPCDVDDKHVEAQSYCSNCEKYMCTSCITSHKHSGQTSDHSIQELQHMTHKPPVSKHRSTTNLNSDKTGNPAPGDPKLQPASTTRPHVTMATHVKDIKIKGDIISSALLSKDQLVVVDYYNNEVALVDTESGRHVAELQLLGRPWQVTRISDTEAAVTIPEVQKIALLTTQPQLSIVRQIRVQGACYGLAYKHNRFIVTFSEGCVEIVDKVGTVLQTIATDQAGMRIFSNPRYVTAVNDTGTSMYVSDWAGSETSSVVLIMEGIVLTKYERDTSGNKCQVAVDGTGMVYVALEGGQGGYGWVDQLTGDCDRVRTIIPVLKEPYALSYDEASQLLYVGQYGVVRVYRLF